jgi:hypothetical protein
LIAPHRSLSQLSTSFIASLRQGILTHALSSLTIKFTTNTDIALSPSYSSTFAAGPQAYAIGLPGRPQISSWRFACYFVVCPSIFNCQRSRGRTTFAINPQSEPLAGSERSSLRTDIFSASSVVGLDRLELSTLRLSGVRSNHLSYRP